MAVSRVVPTPRGDARLYVDRSRHPIATLVLGHGAAGGAESRDLAALAAALPAQGVSVYRVDQPWRVAGRRIAAPPSVLDECWASVVNTMRPRTPLVIGGRSAGARVACRTARQLGASGCVALAFPLRPPHRRTGSDGTRENELLAAGVPTLVVQGDRDPFGAADAFPDTVDLAVVPGADHGFAVRARDQLSQDEALAVLVEAVLEWITREVA